MQKTCCESHGMQQRYMPPQFRLNSSHDLLNAVTGHWPYHFYRNHVSGINFLVLSDSVNLTSAPLSVSCLFMLHLLTLSTHHSHHPYLPISFTPGSRPTSFANLSLHTTDSLPASGLTPRYSRCGPFLLSISIFGF